MIAIILKQGERVKVLGPIDETMDQSHKIVMRLRTRAMQLKIDGFECEAAFIEEFDGGDLIGALSGLEGRYNIGEGGPL